MRLVPAANIDVSTRDLSTLGSDRCSSKKTRTRARSSLGVMMGCTLRTFPSKLSIYFSTLASLKSSLSSDVDVERVKCTPAVLAGAIPPNWPQPDDDDAGRRAECSSCLL